MTRTMLVAIAVLLAWPSEAFACPVCGLASLGDNGGAYFGMTLVMSALPLAMIGGMVVWVRGRLAAEDEDN